MNCRYNNVLCTVDAILCSVHKVHKCEHDQCNGIIIATALGQRVWRLSGMVLNDNVGMGLPDMLQEDVFVVFILYSSIF